MALVWGGTTNQRKIFCRETCRLLVGHLSFFFFKVVGIPLFGAVELGTVCCSNDEQVKACQDRNDWITFN